MAGYLKLHVLSTGSGGNSSIVENATDGTGVVIDCGICKRDFFSRCDSVGFDPRKIKAILITHDHSDHTKGLGVVMRGLRKLGSTPAILAQENALIASKELRALKDDFEIRTFETDAPMTIAGIAIRPFCTSHDAASSCGFRFELGEDSIGFMTDTGIVTKQAHEALGKCRILAIESNHDRRMLANGEYPYYLKERIASSVGHLSNAQAADELESLLWPGLEQVVAMHISKNNNTFDLAHDTMQSVLDACGHGATLQCGYESKPVSVE